MNDNSTSSEALKKSIGFWGLLAMGVGAVIGDGIFLLMGEAIQTAGPVGGLLAFLVAGLLQIALMIGLSELAVAIPSPGGMALWVEKFLGKWWGFLTGISFALGYVITGATCGIAIGKFTCYWFPSLDSQVWTMIFALGFNLIFAVINIFGTQLAAKTQLAITVALVIIMAAFAILGIGNVDLSNFSPAFVNGMDGFTTALPMGVYAYMGAVCLTTAGGECKRPRDLGKALLWSGVVFVVLYASCQFVATGIVPFDEVGLDTSIFTLAAEKVFGAAGGTILNIAAWFAAATCLLMGSFYTSSRVFYQLAKSHGLPRRFAVLGKHGTPTFGIIITYIAVVICTLIAYYAPDAVYVALTNQNVMVWVIAWGLALICPFILRKKHYNLIEKSGWKQPLWPVFPIIGIIGCAYTFYLGVCAGPVHVLITVCWIGISAAYYFLYAKKNYTGMLSDDEDSGAKLMNQL